MCSIAGSDFSWRNLEMCMVQCWYLNPIFQDPKEENCSATTQNLLVSRVSQLPEQAITNTLQGRKGTADAMDLRRSEGRFHQAKCGVKQQHAGIYPAKKTLDLYTRIRFGGSQWVLAMDLHKTGLSNTQNGFNQQNLGLCQQQNQWFHRFTICQQVLIHPNCVVDNVLSQSTNGSQKKQWINWPDQLIHGRENAAPIPKYIIMSMWNMTWPKLLDFGVANFQTNLSIMCSGSSIRSFLAPHVSF